MEWIIWLFKLTFAGIWPLVWHWGIGVGIILICIAVNIFGGRLPFIGPEIRKDALWVAVSVALALGYAAIIQRDEANRCMARGQIVHEQVIDAASPAKQPHKDKWETDQ